MHPEKAAKLVEISRKLSSFDDLDDLVQSIVDVSADLCEAEGGALLLFDEADKQLRYVAASWFPRHPQLRAALENVAVPAEAGITGKAFREAAPQVARKEGTTPLVHPALAAHFPAPVTSMAAVPLSYQKLTIGVLECTNHRAGGFGPEDIEILQTLASLTAVAIYNAHLLNRTQTAYEELANLDRMKSEFIAITSHELRTPVGVIIGHTTLLQEIADRDVREHLVTIERNATQLKEIIENLTTVNHFDRKNAPLLQKAISLRTLIESALQRFNEPAQRRKISLRHSVPEPDAALLGDEEKLGIVLHNLLKNALAFTEEGRGKILVSAKIQGDTAKISVIDNGIGIPQKDLARIFERFYQVEGHMRRKHGGMGLGLSVAQYMVELHGGAIWAESVEGEGSSINFTIPLSREKQSNANSVFLSQ